VKRVRLARVDQTELDQWLQRARMQPLEGQLLSYVPKLAEASPEWLAIALHTVFGQQCLAGEVELTFALMSLVKPFLLFCLLETLGPEVVFRQVGQLPSEQPFNAVNQLRVDRGWPRNPMINSGAIALADLLPGKTGSERCQYLRQWLNQRAECSLVLDSAMLASVRSLPNQCNRDLTSLLARSGFVKSTALALDTYNQICCLTGTVSDLARLGRMLASSTGFKNSDSAVQVMALMLTCGLYEVSGPIAVTIGLPMKSSVSGGLLAIVPGEGSIAVYSPPLDKAGNSVRGLWLIQNLARQFGLSLFRG